MKSIFYAGQNLPKSLFVLFFLAFSASLFAQQASLTVQGVLTKADGSAVEDDVYDMTFRLWNHPDATGAANKKHEELIVDVETVGGVYTVILGINGTPLNAGFDEVYYLGVSMNSSNVELLPRPRLTHAPYALGIKGQNNTFPSTGPVIADAFRARGGNPVGGQGADGNGFSFKPGGDEGGGMYSRQANNIELWAGGQERMQLNTTQNEIYGQTVNFGPFISNNMTVNGNQQINGSSTVTSGQTVTNGQTVSNGQTVNDGQTINGNNYTSGTITSDSRILTDFLQGGGGFSFKDDTGWDTGLFSSADGTFGFLCNGQTVLTSNTSRVTIEKDFYLTSAPNMTDGDNLEWRSNVQGGRVGVNTSSRRYKYNIQPLKVDFTRMLQVEPRIYNRKTEGDDKWEIGYIAEEIDSLGMKDLVLYDEQGRPNSLIYKKFIIYTNELVKMQHKDIETLKAQITVLSNEIQQLQTANNTLQTANNNLKGTNNTLQEQQKAISAQLEVLSKRISAIEIGGTGK